MSLIDSPDKFFIAVGVLFSFLLSIVAAGTTYNIMYEERDKHYQLKEVIKSGLVMFVLIMIITVLLVFVLPRFLNN